MIAINKYLAGFIVIFLIISCNNNDKRDNSRENPNDELYKIVEEKIILKWIEEGKIDEKNIELALNDSQGGTYDVLSSEFYDSPNNEFLYVALIMANKHNYGRAYLDVYYILTDYFHKKEFTELDDLDERTRKLALDCLISGAKAGDRECKKMLGYYYIEGKYLTKDVEKGNKLKNEGEN